jgi:hypothetical protein
MNTNIPDYIKPGAFVRSRSGQKGRIYATDGGNHPIHAAVLLDDGWNARVWTVEDVIGPWIDEPDASELWPVLPPGIQWLAMDKDGTWYGYPTEPDLCDECWIRPSVCWVPPEYFPKFTGDWKDSKIRRPQTT